MAKKNNIRGMGFLFIFIAIVLHIFSININSEITNFKKNGLVANAKITRLYKAYQYGSKTKTEKADIMFFAKTNNNEITEKNNESGLKEQLDAIMNKVKHSNILGDFTSTTVDITSKIYGSLKVGDHIDILFLADNPEKTKLKLLVDEFNHTSQYIFDGILFSIGCILIGISFRIKNSV